MPNVLRSLIISISFIAVCWWALQGSPTFQACVQQNHTETASGEPKENVAAFLSQAAATYRDCLGEFIHDRKDEILVAFTIILAFSTIFLWVATSDLVKGAERTSRRQLRAYLGIERIGIKQVTASEKPIVTLYIKNFGQTPAYKVHYIMSGIVLEKGRKKLPILKKADLARRCSTPETNLASEAPTIMRSRKVKPRLFSPITRNLSSTEKFTTKMHLANAAQLPSVTRQTAPLSQVKACLESQPTAIRQTKKNSSVARIVHPFW